MTQKDVLDSQSSYYFLGIFMAHSNPTSYFLPPDVQVIERGWLSSNNIVVCGDHHTALVDTGYVSHEAQTLALVGAALKGRVLDTLVNTHLHSDHCGGNSALQVRYPLANTYVPKAFVSVVQAWDTDKLSFESTGQLCKPFTCTGAVVPGSSLVLGNHQWYVLAAPGHDPDSVILFQPDFRCLISADALWENGFGVVFPELDGMPGFEDVGLSLDLIESLDAKVVIPGHGKPFTDVTAALKNARSRLASFQQDSARHARHGAKVLLKFKLMELQHVPMDEFIRWACQTKLVLETVGRYFPQQTPKAFVSTMLADLIMAGVARQSEGNLCDAS
jgi:glyoxylase-like metal-dependent hydrolase (beta-lactamase superfamily II)